MKTLSAMDVADKKVLVRVDFNVPMNEDGEVTDDLRIQMALPTISYLLEQKAKIVLCTHMGRPKGERVAKYSLAPVAGHLSKVLGRDVQLAPDCIGAETTALVEGMQPGDIVMLENLRFYREETDNDPGFAQQLAAMADVFVNDAFAVSHRAHASVVGVAEFIGERLQDFSCRKNWIISTGPVITQFVQWWR